MDPHDSIFRGLNLVTVGFAAFMATLVGALHTWSVRVHEAASGKRLSPWRSVIPDMLIGTVTATIAIPGIVHKWPEAHNFTSVSLIAALSGLIAPKAWDVVSRRGLPMLLDYLARAVAGPLGQWAAARLKEEEANVEQPEATEKGGGSDAHPT